MPRYSRKKKQLLDKHKALKLAEVYQETGKLDFKEAYRRLHPKQSERSVAKNFTRIMTEEVMDEVGRLIQMRDKELLKKLKPEVIVQDLLRDLCFLNVLRDKGELTVEEMAKVLNAKSTKQKLLGMVIGMWKADKPQEREKTAQELLNELGRFRNTDTKEDK